WPYSDTAQPGRTQPGPHGRWRWRAQGRGRPPHRRSVRSRTGDRRLLSRAPGYRSGGSTAAGAAARWRSRARRRGCRAAVQLEDPGHTAVDARRRAQMGERGQRIVLEPPVETGERQRAPGEHGEAAVGEGECEVAALQEVVREAAEPDLLARHVIIDDGLVRRVRGNMSRAGRPNAVELVASALSGWCRRGPPARRVRCARRA